MAIKLLKIEESDLSLEYPSRESTWIEKKYIESTFARVYVSNDSN